MLQVLWEAAWVWRWAAAHYLSYPSSKAITHQNLLIFKALIYNTQNSESLWVGAAFSLQLWILSAKPNPCCIPAPPG